MSLYNILCIYIFANIINSNKKGDEKMKRTFVKDIFADKEAFGGKAVTVAGWARSIRSSNVFGFIELNDGSCFKNVQVVFEAEKLGNYKEIAKQNVGAALIVEEIGRAHV